MSPDLIFSLGSHFVLLGWLALAGALFLARPRAALLTFAGMLMPAVLAVAYLALLVATFARGGVDMSGMSALAGIKRLYGQDLPALAVWFHFLAFDLFIGAWIVRDAVARHVWPGLVLVILIVTLAAGPLGLLTYLLLRAVGWRRAAV